MEFEHQASYTYLILVTQGDFLGSLLVQPVSKEIEGIAEYGFAFGILEQVQLSSSQSLTLQTQLNTSIMKKKFFSLKNDDALGRSRFQ